MGLLAFVLVLLFFPETSHPGATGLERLNARREKRGQPPCNFAFLNPLASLDLLRSPNLLAVVRASNQQSLSSLINVACARLYRGRSYTTLIMVSSC